MMTAILNFGDKTNYSLPSSFKYPSIQRLSSGSTLFYRYEEEKQDLYCKNYLIPQIIANALDKADISHNISKDLLKHIIHALNVNTSLKSFELKCRMPESVSIQIILCLAKHPALESFIIESKEISMDMILALNHLILNALKLTSLVVESRLSNETLSILSEAVNVKGTFKNLKITFGDYKLKASTKDSFTKMLENNHSLNELFIVDEGNQIYSAISEYLKVDNSIQNLTLEMSYNMVSLGKGEEFINSLEANSTLTCLKMSITSLSTPIQQSVASMLAINKNLKSLTLLVPFDEQTIEFYSILIDILIDQNYSLQNIKVGYSNIFPFGQAPFTKIPLGLKKLLERNKTLEPVLEPLIKSKEFFLQKECDEKLVKLPFNWSDLKKLFKYQATIKTICHQYPKILSNTQDDKQVGIKVEDLFNRLEDYKNQYFLKLKGYCKTLNNDSNLAFLPQEIRKAIFSYIEIYSQDNKSDIIHDDVTLHSAMSSRVDLSPYQFQLGEAQTWYL
jgi:hypothetical protein